jgi:hypothetical protein
MKDTSHFSRRVLLRQFSRSAAAAACLPLLNLAERGHGAPPPKDVPARVSLDPSGLITSPAGDLTDGVNRVECTFNPNGGDLRLNTYHAAAFNLAAELSGQIVPPPCPVVSPPVNSWGARTSDIWFVNIGSLLYITSGSWTSTEAMFWSRSLGQFRLGTRVGFCSTPVQARYLGGNSWEVQATSSEIAVLAQQAKTGYVPAAYFHLPFRMTVTAL